MLILQFLGAIFVLVLLLAGYFGWKFYRTVTAYQRTDFTKALAALPVQELDMDTSARSEWINKSQLDAQEDALRKRGATHLGYFAFYSQANQILISLWDYKTKAMAALYEAQVNGDEENASFIYEMVSKIEGGSICITSNAAAELDSRPPEHLLSYDHASSAVDFLKVIKRKAPENTKFLRIKQGLSFFRDVYADCSEWAWREEQLRSDKTQQAFAALGVDANEELMQQLIEMGHQHTVEVYIDKARARLAKHSSMSLERWERIRDELVFVHEKMQKDDITGAVWQLLGDLSESQDEVVQGFEFNLKDNKLIDPVAAFQLLLQALDVKARRIARMDSPILTEVYLPLHA